MDDKLDDLWNASIAACESVYIIMLPFVGAVKSAVSIAMVSAFVEDGNNSKEPLYVILAPGRLEVVHHKKFIICCVWRIGTIGVKSIFKNGDNKSVKCFR